MKHIDSEAFELPDISLAGLKLWVAGRQFEHSTDFWDANWLVVTVQCSSSYSNVAAQGPIIHLSEIEQWISELQKLSKRLAGEARLNCMETELNVKMTLDGRTGAGSLRVCITPDYLTERHEFIFPIDQSYLPKLIGELQNILKQYPITGAVA